MFVLTLRNSRDRVRISGGSRNDVRSLKNEQGVQTMRDFQSLLYVTMLLCAASLASAADCAEVQGGVRPLCINTHSNVPRGIAEHRLARGAVVAARKTRTVTLHIPDYSTITARLEYHIHTRPGAGDAEPQMTYNTKSGDLRWYFALNEVADNRRRAQIKLDLWMLRAVSYAYLHARGVDVAVCVSDGCTFTDETFGAYDITELVSYMAYASVFNTPRQTYRKKVVNGLLHHRTQRSVVMAFSGDSLDARTLSDRVYTACGTYVDCFAQRVPEILDRLLIKHQRGDYQ